MAIALFVSIFLLALPFLLFVLLKHRISNNGSFNRLPPSPPSLPLIGHLHMLMFDNSAPYLFLYKLSQKYGPLMFLRFGFRPTLVVSSAKMAEEVMKTHDLDFCSRPNLYAARKLSYNASDLSFSPYNHYWREMRKVCVVHLFSRVQKYRHIREDEVARLIEKICQFSIDSKPINLSEDIFIAGTDTAVATMIWVMSFLMKNPKCLKKAQVEVRDLVGGKGFVNEDDVQGLIYLKAVIKETFRLQPVAPLLLPRETRRKCSIGGYEVPAKTLVYVNAWAIGREPEAWENPQDFCPERFIGSSIDYKGLNFELIPFGAGRRVCPGMHMGVAEVELGLANLLYKFDWEMPNGMNREDLDFDAVNGLTTHKKNALILRAKKIND